ncbi:UDP-N-acetylmuramate dehydrogenase [Candidatus Manganitrophus noduliformans]|uniref:UDP-N-acetylenolpyruvoylglucosamine reductase n=1 Tax=Candidatus Manganitrophus noduliformans TaxID=2606439 RepID=A0A7X6IAE4_9BACT|nr:UDP-N-acetylmuramate dehydrogenase [Candidatus Manganitrophus noduliformans]NKE70401.1 UDP-N-acetylmuramate dehydrogenase [Candidatus Manganitrophus noduliformans]
MRLMQMEPEKKEGLPLKEALKDYPGEVRFDEPVAPYTSLKVGGPAEAMVFPRSSAEVVLLMERIGRYRLPYFVLGGGSNLIVRDGGIPGVVVHLKHLSRITFQEPDTLLADAGVSYPKLSTEAMAKGLSGLEFAAGIPGTVGGAIAMNAGIPGEETASVLSSVTLVDEEARVKTLPKEAIQFGYRTAALPKGMVTSASFRLTPASPEEVEEKLKRLLKRRRETQPLSFPNVGSVFTNPPGDYAGRLVESVGLKGRRIGDAQISERHGNFIVNLGQAKAGDVLALIGEMQIRVKAEQGIDLELEAKVVGRE